MTVVSVRVRPGLLSGGAAPHPEPRQRLRTPRCVVLCICILLPEDVASSGTSSCLGVLFLFDKIEDSSLGSTSRIMTSKVKLFCGFELPENHQQEQAKIDGMGRVSCAEHVSDFMSNHDRAVVLIFARDAGCVTPTYTTVAMKPSITSCTEGDKQMQSR